MRPIRTRPIAGGCKRGVGRRSEVWSRDWASSREAPGEDDSELAESRLERLLGDRVVDEGDCSLG